MLALVLLGITLLVNMIGAVILQRASAELEGSNNDAAASHCGPAAVAPIPPDLNPFEGRGLLRAGEISAASPDSVQCLMSGLVTGMTLSRTDPAVLGGWMLLWRGGRKLSLALFTQLPPAPLEQGGGFGNAIVGTLIMVCWRR